jgi:hypothetical protein
MIASRNAGAVSSAPAKPRSARPAFNIIHALDDPKLFQPWFAGPSWTNWRTVLKAAYALPMTPAEIDFFHSVAGGRAPPDRQVRELWIIAGRRAGKDSVASAIAAYSAALFNQQDRLRRGETASIACIACDRSQSRIILDYVKAFFAYIPMLEDLVTRSTAIGFQLRNGVDVEISTNNFKSVRGRPFAVAILDECAFYASETSATPDVELYQAIVPGMATLPNSMIIGISTPWRRAGLLHRKYKDHFGRDGDVLVIQAPSTVLNPTLDPAIVARALEADAAAARSEWLAEFRSDIGAWLDLATIENAVDVGVMVRPPVTGIKYFSGCDPSGGRHDSFTLAISHCEKDVAVLDCVVEIKAPFNPTTATQQIAAVLKSYGLSETTGDKYGAGWIPDAFLKCKISYRPSARDRSAIYSDCLPLFNAGRIQLIDNPRLVAQFAGLERRATVRGDRIDHSPGSFDDASNAAALALVLAAAPAIEQTPPHFGMTTTTGGGFNGAYWVGPRGDDNASAGSIYASRPAADWAREGVFHKNDREYWIRKGVYVPPEGQK